MGLHRLSRFTRAPQLPPFVLTSRDREILRLIFAHRFVRSSHILSLVNGSKQQILRRLQLLFHHGYVERPRIQLEQYHKGGSREIVYGIGDQGAQLLKREHDVTAKELRWSEKNRKVERMFLQHALLVSDIMVAFELACREKNIRLLSEQELQVRGNEKPFHWRVNTGAQQQLTVAPDRVFALEYVTEIGKTERAYFFLEADRGTMPVVRKGFSQSSFFRKLVAYEATWLQRIHEKQYGFHRFRVLTVTTGAARVKSLVGACGQLKQGHGLFLFADKSILEKPGGILAHGWQSARAGETSTLLP